MAILVDSNTKVLIQGITGGEGSRACKEMLEFGTKVVAGVTPKKGGQNVGGVPVYNSVKEALSTHPDINVSLIVVPPQFVKDATLEALEAGIKLINILTEYVPARDSSIMVAIAKKLSARIVGPASVGIISPGKGKIGSIGSGEIKDVFTEGPIGVISKSGGMTAELSLALSRAHFGQSTVVGIGGDIIAGSDYVDLLELFEKDNDTKAVVMFGEVGGTYEEDAADFIKTKKFTPLHVERERDDNARFRIPLEKQQKSNRQISSRSRRVTGFTKPVVAIVGGRFTERLAQGIVLGHAGAIVSKGKGSYDSKVKALRSAGVAIAETIEEIPLLLGKVLASKK